VALSTFLGSSLIPPQAQEEESGFRIDSGVRSAKPSSCRHASRNGDHFFQCSRGTTYRNPALGSGSK